MPRKLQSKGLMDRKWTSDRIEIKSLKKFKAWVFEWVEEIKGRLPHLVLLNGPLGSGKTEWVRFLVEALKKEQKNSFKLSSMNETRSLGEKKKEYREKKKIDSKFEKDKRTDQKKIRDIKSANVMSPSFSFHNRYQVGKVRIDHVDFYRIKDEEDLESTGFWDFFERPKGFIIIEWANRFLVRPDLFPGEVTAIEIKPLKGLRNNEKFIQEEEGIKNEKRFLRNGRDEWREIKIKKFYFI